MRYIFTTGEMEEVSHQRTRMLHDEIVDVASNYRLAFAALMDWMNGIALG